jgi:hypothetical protein
MNYIVNFLLIFIVLCSFTRQVSAEEQSAGDQYGRLFNNSNQRLSIENQRFNPTRAQHLPKKNIELESTTEAPIVKPVTLNGFVKRSDGKTTVWVNRQPIQENTQIDNIRIGIISTTPKVQKGRKSLAQTDSLNINFPTNGEGVQLKAGQQYDPERRQIIEVTTLAKERQILLESANEDSHLE